MNGYQTFLLYVIALCVLITMVVTMISDFHMSHYLLVMCLHSGAQGC